MQTYPASKNEIILDNLFYILCGLDTTYLSIGVHNKKYKLIIDTEYPYEYISPFEDISINIRIVNKYILKKNSCILSIHFKKCVTDYFADIKEFRRSVRDIEGLYVKIQDNIQVFNEMRHIIEKCKDLRNVEIYNFLKDRYVRKFNCENEIHTGVNNKPIHVDNSNTPNRENTIIPRQIQNNEFFSTGNKCILRLKNMYEGILKDFEMKLEKDIHYWITQGSLSEDFMVRKVNVNYENICNSYWKNEFVLNESQIPVNLQSDKYMILQCGKLINLSKALGYTINLNPLISNNQLGLTSSVYSSVRDTLNILLRKDLEEEIRIVKKYIFMSDMSFYNDLFTDLYNDKSFNIVNEYHSNKYRKEREIMCLGGKGRFSIEQKNKIAKTNSNIEEISQKETYCENNINRSFTNKDVLPFYHKINKKLLYKINSFKNFKYLRFRLADLDLNNTIYKILNLDLQVKNNQSILEFLSIDFSPKILSLLLNKKNFLELELIFRVLLTLSIIQFFLQKEYNFRFSKLVVFFIKNFKFSLYPATEDFLDIPENISDLDNLIYKINEIIKIFIKNLCLINEEIYLIISEIIDLSFNFISLENKEECINLEEFEKRFLIIIRKLYVKIQKQDVDWWILNTLECLISDNFMKYDYIKKL